MSEPRNVNRCTPCLNSHHDRCTGSAGSIGCGCIHAAPVPVPLRPVEPLPVVPLDPALVRERLAELDREREVQQGLVDTLANVLDMAQQTLAAIDQRIAATRTHPAVQAALREDQT